MPSNGENLIELLFVVLVDTSYDYRSGNWRERKQRFCHTDFFLRRAVACGYPLNIFNIIFVRNVAQKNPYIHSKAQNLGWVFFLKRIQRCAKSTPAHSFWQIRILARSTFAVQDDESEVI